MPSLLDIRHSLWPIPMLSLLLVMLTSDKIVNVVSGNGGVCHRPPDPGVTYPMYNRLLTVRLPLRQDAATRRWAVSNADDLKSAGLHEIRHLLAAVFPGKLWVHDASSASLESNATQLVLRDLIVELNSPADSDHCSHVFQQHLFMAAETHAADTHFNLRQFSDINVEYRHLFGQCQPAREETVYFYAALRLDKAEAACRNLAGLDNAPTNSFVGQLRVDLRRLTDRLFFMPSSRFNISRAGESNAASSMPPLLLLQSNNAVLVYIAEFRLLVANEAEDWPLLDLDIADRYGRLTRHSDDYGVLRQGAGPNCLNYLNFASQPTAQLVASCRACYDLLVPVSINISLSESADIRPPQCETIGSVRADASRRLMQTRDIVDSIGRNNRTAHLFVPLVPPGNQPSQYFDIRSVSCSAKPKRLVVEASLRLRARHPALPNHPLVIQAGLQRNINAYLVEKHLGLANIRLSGPIAANGAECSADSISSFDGGLSVAVKLCRGAAASSVSIVRHKFQLSVGRESLLLARLPENRPELTVGLVRFLLTAAMSRIDSSLIGNSSLSLAVSARQNVTTNQIAALLDVEAAYVTAGAGPAIISTLDNVNKLNSRFVQSVNELQADFGPLVAHNSGMTVDRRFCANLTAAAATPASPTLTTPTPSGSTTTKTLPTGHGNNSLAELDANRALRLNFTVDAGLLYGGKIGDYLLAGGLNAALRRAGLRDIRDVDLTGRECRAGDSCRVTAVILFNNRSSSSSSGANASGTSAMQQISLSALTAALSSDQLLRPVDIRAETVASQPPQQIPASSIIYRYAVSPYFNTPPLPIGQSNGSVEPLRIAIVWRLVSVNASAPLAYRTLPLDDASANRLRFLLEQMLVDLLRSRLLSWPTVLAYKSDGALGRLDADVTLLVGRGSPLASLSAEVSAAADGFPLVSFVRLSDLRVQSRRLPSATSSATFDSALMLQSFSLLNFVSNTTLQAMPDSDLHRLLSGKLRFVQSAIFSGQAGRPQLLSFEYRARRQLDASIRIDSLSRISWPSSSSAAFDVASLKRLVDSELEALQANVNVFPMAFDIASSTLRLLDSRRGLAWWCDLLLRVQPTPADAAVAQADASWLPVSDRLSAYLAGLFNDSHVTVLSLPADSTAAIDALATLPATGDSCSATVSRLLKLPRIVGARSLSDGVLTAVGASAAPAANLTALVRHSALLTLNSQLTVASSNDSSLADYFCFLTSWAHALFNNQSDSGVCARSLAERHQIRFNPLSSAATPTMRLETVSAFVNAPSDTVMRRFWTLKNFYLTFNETFIDLDRLRLEGQNSSYSSLIITQLPPPPLPPPPTQSPNVGNATTIFTTTTTTQTTTVKNVATVATVAMTTTAPPAPPTTQTTQATQATSTAAAASTPPPPVGPHYVPVDRLANININLSLPSDPWLARYFLYSSSSAESNNNRTRTNQLLGDYLLRSALLLSLERSAWQIPADEIVDIRIRVDSPTMTICIGLDLLLPAGRNAADLESVLRTRIDQSVVLSTVFSSRTYSVSVVSLPVRRFLYRPPAAVTTAAVSQRVSVDHSMLIKLSNGAPDYLRMRTAGLSDIGRHDLLLDFLFQQLTTDALGGAERLAGRPQLLRYKADNELAMVQLRYDLLLSGSSGNTNSNNSSLPLQFNTDFANAWQRLEQAATLRDIAYLDARPGPPPPHRGLLLYQLLRLESYINKKSLMSLPSDYLALLLRPKIEYVMRKVYSGGDSSVPQFLDVDSTYRKKDGALEIVALTRVAIPPGYRLSQLEQRLQLHVMHQLELLANDINLVPSVFSVARTDVRVIDLKEGLARPYWCDLVYSFVVVESPSKPLPRREFELANHLSRLLASQLPPHTHLERLAVLQAVSANGQLEVRALVTLSAGKSLPFDLATNILVKAASASRLITRAVAAAFRVGSNTAAGVSSSSASSSRYRHVTQAVTLIGQQQQQQPLDAEKLGNYACHLYQSSLEAAHWYALYVVPHTCSAAVTAPSVLLAVNQQPALSVTGLRLNISAMVVLQTEPDNVAATATEAFASALTIKNFYFQSEEIVLTEGAARVQDYYIGVSKRPSDGATTAGPLATAATTARPAMPNVTARPLAVLHYNVKLRFHLTNLTWDYLAEPDAPMSLLLVQSLLVDALTANASVGSFARHLVVTNASLDDSNREGNGLVLARFAPATAAPSAEYLRQSLTLAASRWPMAARLFTDRPLVTVWPEFESANWTTPTPGNDSNSNASATKTRQRRSLSSALPTGSFVEHQLQMFGTPALPVFYRFRDLPLRDDPLLNYLTERLLNKAMQRWARTSPAASRSALTGSDWPKLVWLRSDNASVTLSIRYPMPSGLSERDLMDGFASAWVAVNSELAGCSLCMARHQQLRLVAGADAANDAVGLLIYQRLQFDGFVGSNTMRKLDHDDLNQLMRHRLHFILQRLYPGTAASLSNSVANLTLAGFDFECYGRNSTVVAFLLVRLLARGDLREADIRRHVTQQLVGLAANEHVLPAQLSRDGADLRLLVRRSGLPSGTANWFDIQATFDFAEPSAALLHGYSLAFGARRHLEQLLSASKAASSLTVAQLRLMRWKRLGPSGQQLGGHHQLVTVLATLASSTSPTMSAELTPAELRALLANYTGLSGPNLTLPLLDFDHQPRHYDQHHLSLVHSGMAVQLPLHLLDADGVQSDDDQQQQQLLASDFLCLLLASSFRQRGSHARLQFVDDSCAARVSPNSRMSPHPLSARRISATSAIAYFTLHNASRPFSADEATDAVSQLAGALNAYADVPGRMLAVGDVAPIGPAPIYQLLRFASAAGFPEQLRNASSPIYQQTTETIKRSLAVYLRSVANRFSGRVTDVRYRGGSVDVLINYLIYPRLLNVELAAKEIESSTESLFTSNSPFHGLQLDREASFVSASPIADQREPKLDKKADHQPVPIAIYCILAVACFLLLVLCTLLVIRLVRMRRNNYGSRIRPQASTNSHRRSLLYGGDDKQGVDAEKGIVETERNNNNNNIERPATDPTRLPSTEVPPPPPPLLPQPPADVRRASSASNRRRASAIAATAAPVGPLSKSSIDVSRAEATAGGSAQVPSVVQRSRTGASKSEDGAV